MNFSVDFYSFIHRLFEDAADKLNLMALAGFLYQLKKASQAQLFHSVTDTVDYSLAMPGRKKNKKTKNTGHRNITIQHFTFRSYKKTERFQRFFGQSITTNE